MRRLAHTIWVSAPRWTRRLFIWLREPHFLVTVAAAVINDKGEILLCDHVFRKGSSWGMPGGFVMKGEDPEDALRRELNEELGVAPTSLSLVMVRTFPRSRQLEIVYRCGIDGTPKADSVELRATGWFSLDQLPPLTRDQRDLVLRVSRADGAGSGHVSPPR